MRSKFTALAVAAVGLALLGQVTPASAEVVTYSTVGTFTGGDAAGTNVFLDAANGTQITFNGIVTNSVNANPSSGASFGAFDTTGTTATTEKPVSSGFTLDIFQTAPTAGGPLAFVGALSGTLSVDASHSYVQFNTPLSGTIGSILYSIASADMNTPGRVDLVPSTTNGGVSTVQGLISSVPEPSVFALSGLVGSVLLVARLRNRKTRAAV